MEGAGADSQVFDMPSVQAGGKKRLNKNNKKGGAGVETVLAPAVLYGLRRLATPGGDKRRKKQRGGDAFSSQAAPVGESTGPLVAFPVAVAPAGVAMVPPSGDMVPKEAVAVSTDSGDKPLEGGAKKSRKGKKGPMAKGYMNVSGEVKAWGGDKKDDDNDKELPMYDSAGGKKKRINKKKGGDKKDDKDNNNQDGGKKKRNNSKKLKGGALDLYAKQLEQISNSLNNLLFN